MSEEIKKTLFTYPLRDSINDKIDAKRDAMHSFNPPFGFTGSLENEAMDEDTHIFQQSFLGLSIMDFSSSLGFNSDASSLTVNLIQDDVNNLTPLTPSGLRDAVTEGYHPWDTKAFPKSLIEGECTPGQTMKVNQERKDKGEDGKCYDKDGEPIGGENRSECIDNCPEEKSPCSWTQYDEGYEMGLAYKKYGDLECFPEPGTPVFFKYYDGKHLTEDCVTKKTSDAHPKGEDCQSVFNFSGLISKWEKQYSTSGFTYSVNITDPREILENTIIVLDDIVDRTAPPDKHVIKGSERTYTKGWNGYYNIVNVFGYYELHAFGGSDRDDLGMIWYDPHREFKSMYLGQEKDKDSGIDDEQAEAGETLADHKMGVLPALRLILSGRNVKYLDDQEPFGGPIYYGLDNRLLKEGAAPLSEGQIKNEDGEVKEEYRVHRYIVDLDDLVKLTSGFSVGAETLSDYTETGTAGVLKTPKAGQIPSTFRIEGDRPSLLNVVQQVCDAAGVDFQVRLLSPKEAESSSTNYAPWADKSKYMDQVKHYSGVIKVIPLIKLVPDDYETRGQIRRHIEDSQKTPEAIGPFSFRGISKLVNASMGREFVDPIAGQVIYGAPRTRVVGVTPLGDMKLRKELFFNMQTQKYMDKTNFVGKCIRKSDNQDTGHQDEESCLEDKDAGPGWCDAKLGIADEHCVGVYETEVHCLENPNCRWIPDGKSINKWITFDDNTAPKDGRDDILREFLPSIEMDGVTLYRQSLPVDNFKDRESYGWNPYGPESRREYQLKRDPSGRLDESLQFFKPTKDFEQNLPPVSNDDYLPWHFPEDYQTDGGADPTQFNRANSRHREIKGTCSVQYCNREADRDACIAKPDADSANCFGVYEDQGNCLENPNCTWILEGSVIPDEQACGNFGGEWAFHENDQEGCESVESGIFKPTYTEDLSGYLDIFPCWGFKEKLFSPLNEEKKLLLDDIIDIKQQGKPIKGFFWDDDPYRDFHPSEGIFGTKEFYNPGLGVCIVDKAAGSNDYTETGMEITALENKKDICECNPLKNPDKSDCALEWETAGVANEDFDVGFKAKWKPHCVFHAECRDAEGNLIESLHADNAGAGKDEKGNNLTDSAYSCTQACFDVEKETDDVPKDMDRPIVAYYAKPSENPLKNKGDAATVNDLNFTPNVRKGVVKFIKGSDDCSLSGKNRVNKDGAKQPDILRKSFPIAADGKFAFGDGNSFSSSGGEYSERCKAISFKLEWSACCVAKKDIEVDGKRFFKGACTDAINEVACKKDYDGDAVWNTIADGSFHPEVKDTFTGRTIPTEDIPSPGYINVRHKVEGRCKGKVVVEGEATEDFENIELERDVNNTLTDEQLCYANNKENKYVYDTSKPILMPIQPRTATIPVDLTSIGYTGGPVADVNGPNNEFTGYYYATVTELRHAAVSQDSWLTYIREIQPFLACLMYSQNPSDVSLWKDYCPTVRRSIFRGGKSNAHLHAQDTLSRWGNGRNPKPISRAAIDHAGRPNIEDALALQGHICGKDPENATLNIAQETKMEVETAYKKIKEIATEFYGRKYLVPLPFNPPTSITCTHPKYKDKGACEREGFDWGSHGLVSAWFRTFGLGSCVNEDNEPYPNLMDRHTCEGAGHVWIEPVQEQNKWNIVSSAWPGGDISTTFDRNKAQAGTHRAGYPENMNFWTDEGNLKAFAVFPEKDLRRLNGDATENERLDFSAWNPEQIHLSTDRNKASERDEYGSKVFATVEVDPKTHWLNDRPDWEIQQQKQYFKFREGDPTSEKGFAVEVGEEDAEGATKEETGDEEALFLKVGPKKNEGQPARCVAKPGIEDAECVGVYEDETNCIENPNCKWIAQGLQAHDLEEVLNARDVFVFEPDEFVCKKDGSNEPITHVCINKNTEKIIGDITDRSKCTEEEGIWTEITEEICTGETDEDKALGAKWSKVEKKRIEYAAYKPYALVTLPSQVYYGNIDRANKLSESFGGNQNDVCIPLIAGQGRSALFSAWLQGMSASNIATQQIIRISSRDKSVAVLAPDTRRASFIAAAYKPWHAAIPQQSTVYRWGPWAAGRNFGRPDFQVDDGLHPAALGGETKMSNLAMTRLGASLSKSQTHIESGSVTVAGFVDDSHGHCNASDAVNQKQVWHKDDCARIGGVWIYPGKNYLANTNGPGLGDQLSGIGPFVTDINVQIGANGIQVTYNLSTRKRFGDLEKLHENRIRKNQTDILRARSAAERQLSRVKRGIDQFRR